MLTHRARKQSGSFGQPFGCPAIKATGFVLAMTLAISNIAFAQSDTASASGTAGSQEDPTVLLFEDLYGRFPDGVMPSLFAGHNQISYKGLYTPTPANSNYTNGGINVTVGDRKSYEITGGIQNFGGTGSLPSQSYNLAFYSRPITGWEFGGTAQFSRAPEQALTNQYYLGLTVLNFSSGEVNLSERRMQQYYYFSNLLPDPGQTVVSFTPTYSFIPSRITSTQVRLKLLFRSPTGSLTDSHLSPTQTSIGRRIAIP